MNQKPRESQASICLMESRGFAYKTTELGDYTKLCILARVLAGHLASELGGSHSLAGSTVGLPLATVISLGLSDALVLSEQA